MGQSIANHPQFSIMDDVRGLLSLHDSLEAFADECCTEAGAQALAESGEFVQQAFNALIEDVMYHLAVQHIASGHDYALRPRSAPLLLADARDLLKTAQSACDCDLHEKLEELAERIHMLQLTVEDYYDGRAVKLRELRTCGELGVFYVTSAKLREVR